MTTRCWPLFEIVDGVLTVTKEVKKPKPLSDYFKLQGRFKSITDEQVEAVRQEVDAAYDRLMEGRV